MTTTLDFNERNGMHAATGDSGQLYRVTLALPGDEYPWVAMTTGPHHPRKLGKLAAAKRLCQAWEDCFQFADELLMNGNLEMAERIRRGGPGNR
jgi:hypothetical protein